MARFQGIIPPLVTPFQADEALNLAALPALVEHVLAGGVHGVFVAGSQGESFTLSAAEKAALLDATLAAVNGRVPVIAGTGAITTRDTIILTQQAERGGASAVSIITPYFVTPSQDELYAHYADVAAAVTVPILAYSNPSRTGGVKIAPDTLARLAKDIPHFIGVKDSSGDLAETAAIIRACPPEFQVFVGRDSLFYGGLCYGATGAVALSANVVPALFRGVYDAFGAGDHSRARELQDKISVLRDGLLRFGSYPVPVKEALNLMGLPAGPTRRPIRPLNDTQRSELKALLRRVGVEV